MTDVKKPAPLVLLIEDEISIRNSLTIFLEDYGFDTQEAEDGKDGLAMIQAIDPDIVLCDLRMPGMDGMEVLATVQQIRPGLPVIIISGTSLGEEIEEAIKMGAFAYIVKPIVDLTELLDKIQQALEAKSHQNPEI
ncbi:MAG: response regulator [Desulfobacterium sp.]|nr:response regulator [Desulfobacterium sp.]